MKMKNQTAKPIANTAPVQVREPWTEVAHEPEPRKVWRGTDVTYNSGTCPNCGSQHNHIYKTYERGRLGTDQVVNRLHTCLRCEVSFRSLQWLNPVDCKD